MHRFFIQDIEDSTLVLEGDEARHLARALRLGPGDLVELLDGRGGRRRARVIRTGRGRAVLEAAGPVEREPPPERPLVLAQCLLKGRKMDMVLQRGTELGAAAFIPVYSSRCQGQGRDAGERAMRVLRAACKQCGRAWLPGLWPPTRLEDLLRAPPEPGLALHEGCKRLLVPADLPERGGLCLLVGPEGGLAPFEVEAAREAGWGLAGLGPLVLRAETAALAGTAVCMHMLRLCAAGGD